MEHCEPWQALKIILPHLELRLNVERHPRDDPKRAKGDNNTIEVRIAALEHNEITRRADDLECFYCSREVAQLVARAVRSGRRGARN